MTLRKLSSIAAAVLALAAAAASSQAAPSERVRMIVAYKPGAAAAVRDAIARAGGRVRLELQDLNAVAVTLPRAAVQALSAHRGVDYVEEDRLRRVQGNRAAAAQPGSGDAQATPYGIESVQADQLVSATPKWTPRLCIIDSGIDATHEDLAGNALAGRNFSGSGDWNTDENSHGTHVAGTVAALDNGLGVVGVNGKKQLALYIAKVFDATGSAPSSTIALAMNQCAKVGANIVSMSLGGSSATRTEQRAADALVSKGALLVAAAGNDGDATVSYPAGFASVMSVAAVDDRNRWASFSQFNSDVEIAGPGVGVLSTVPLGSQVAATLTVGSSAYASLPMEGSPRTSASGPLADFGLGDVATAGAMTGKVCLISRGSISFADKVTNCQNSGGVAAVVYNNTTGELSGTLGETVTNIPSAGTTQADGQSMLRQLGQSTALSVFVTDDLYAAYDGTSMATPHVSGVAGLVWSFFPQCSAEQMRSTLRKSAKDIDAHGVDVRTGAGLVQAKAAYDRIATLGCGN
jgi:subtilisin family serine protease